MDCCQDIGLPFTFPVPLHTDNESVFRLNSGRINHAGSKHYRIAQAFIVEMIKSSKVVMVKIDTKKNRADLLTKALGLLLHTLHSETCFGT
jgi:hypothetical protein